MLCVYRWLDWNRYIEGELGVSTVLAVNDGWTWREAIWLFHITIIYVHSGLYISRHY